MISNGVSIHQKRRRYVYNNVLFAVFFLNDFLALHISIYVYRSVMRVLEYYWVSVTSFRINKICLFVCLLVCRSNINEDKVCFSWFVQQGTLAENSYFSTWNYEKGTCKQIYAYKKASYIICLSVRLCPSFLLSISRAHQNIVMCT